jgi:predicted DCC family thiol-disulfide oxidoreductase YuxK
LSSAYLLAYDADCGPCSRFKAIVDFFDARGVIEFTSLKQAEEAGALGTIDSSLRYRSFHLVMSGQGVLSGADALLPLVKLLLPGGGVVSRALAATPGFGRALSFGYAALSRLHDVGACSAAET